MDLKKIDLFIYIVDISDSYNHLFADNYLGVKH